MRTRTKQGKMDFIKAFWVGYLSGVLGWVTSFFMPIAPFMGLVAVLVIADFFTGVRAAKSRGEKILSSGIRRTIEKITLYLLALLLSEAMRVVFAPSAPVAYVTAFAIAITEFKSNIENIETVTGVAMWSSIKKHFHAKD